MMEISAGGPICGENQMSCLEQVAQRDKRLCANGGKNGVLPEKEKEKNTLKKKRGSDPVRLDRCQSCLPLFEEGQTSGGILACNLQFGLSVGRT